MSGVCGTKQVEWNMHGGTEWIWNERHMQGRSEAEFILPLQMCFVEPNGTKTNTALPVLLG